MTYEVESFDFTQHRSGRGTQVYEGHELARMIGTGGRWIAAVIGGNDQLVARPKK